MLCRLLALILLSTPKARGNDMDFEHISSREGLVDLSIFCITRDSYGFLWVGASFGLSRYDGYKWVQLKSNKFDPRTIPFNYVNSVIETRSGRLYFGSSDGGFCYYDRQHDLYVPISFKNTKVNTPYISQILTIIQDKDGQMWLGTRDGLLKYDETGDKHQVYFPTGKVANNLSN